MKFEIEIWRYHVASETFENDDIKEVLSWYEEEWKNTYENGGCTFYIFEDEKELSFDEEYELGFYN
jgi:hypothetical protein